MISKKIVCRKLIALGKEMKTVSTYMKTIDDELFENHAKELFGAACLVDDWISNIKEDIENNKGK